MKLAFVVVRSLDRKRAAFQEQQQHLAGTRLDCAAAPAKVADHPRSEDLLVQTGGAAHIQRRKAAYRSASPWTNGTG